MTDYVLHDEKGNVVQKGSHAQVLQYLAAQAQESRWSSLARHDANERRRVLTRDIGIFDAACREFNRVQDNLKSVMSDSSSAAQRYLALREQEFDTLYEGAHRRGTRSASS